MKPSLLQKYFMKEFAASFFTAIFILSFIISLGQLFEVQNETAGNVGFKDSLIICFFLLVGNSHLIIPMALLYSLLLVFSKLTTQYEMTALNSCGISQYIFFKPVVMISIFFFFVSLSLSGFAAPSCYQKMKLKIFDIIKTRSIAFLNEGIFNEDFFSYIIYIEKIDKKNNELKNIMLFQKDNTSEIFHPEGIIFAQSGFLNIQETPFLIALYLKNGVYNFPTKGNLQKIEFKNAALRLNTQIAIDQGKYEKRQRLDILFSIRNQDRVYSYLFYEKLHLSLASALFGILALALTFLNYQLNKGLAFLITLACIFVYFGYYKYLMSIMLNFKIAYIPYLMAVPNVILLLLSSFILYRTYDR